MPAALYEEDFQEPGSLEEFRVLLALADDWFEIQPAADPDSISMPGMARNRRYEEVGVYVAVHSQILIALWDGVDSGKMGGTSEIVKFRTEGPADHHECNLQPPELFPVYHIVTPRRSNPRPPGEPFHVKEKHPAVFRKDQRSQSYYSTLFGNLDRFNRLIAEGRGSLNARARRAKRHVLGGFDETSLADSEALALDRYAIADALASQFRRKQFRMQVLLHVAIFLSFTCFVLFAHLLEFDARLLILSLLFLAGAFAAHWYARRIALDDQSLDYRAVAEGARVRFFWKIANVDQPVQDNYLNIQPTELDWIRNGLRGWSITAGGLSAASFLEVSDRLEFAYKHWVEHQARYFHEAGEFNLRWAEFIEWGGAACALATVILAGILTRAGVLLHFGQGLWRLHGSDSVLGSVTAIELLLAIGALLHHFSQRMAYSEHAKQYNRMEGIFRNASRFVRAKLAANDLAGARTCLLKLGQEALAENGEWVLLHRERPLELPHP